MAAGRQGLWQKESGGFRALSQDQFGNSRPWDISLQHQVLLVSSLTRHKGPPSREVGILTVSG